MKPVAFPPSEMAAQAAGEAATEAFLEKSGAPWGRPRGLSYRRTALFMNPLDGRISARTAEAETQRHLRGHEDLVTQLDRDARHAENRRVHLGVRLSRGELLDVEHAGPRPEPTVRPSTPGCRTSASRSGTAPVSVSAQPFVERSRNGSSGSGQDLALPNRRGGA